MMKIKPLTILMLLLFTLPAFAQDRVIDNAGLLNSNQKTQLEGLIASIAAAYNFDLVIVTERNIDDAEAWEYADDFFDNYRYGLGPNRDGSLFLHVTETREYEFSQSGRGESVLNDTAFGKLEDDAVKYFKQGNSFEAYRSFLLNWEKFLSLDAKGRSYNFFTRWNVVVLIVSWALGILIGVWILAVWKSKMNTALAKEHADAYTVSGSLVYKMKSDRFLYSTVTKTRREKASSSGGSSGKSGGRSRGGKY